MSFPTANTEMAGKVTTGSLLLASNQAEAREAQKRPTMRRTVPTTTQNEPVQNANSAEMEKPGSMLINFMFKSNNHVLTYLHFVPPSVIKRSCIFRKKERRGKRGDKCISQETRGFGGDSGRHVRSPHLN